MHTIARIPASFRTLSGLTLALVLAACGRGVPGPSPTPPTPNMPSVPPAVTSPPTEPTPPPRETPDNNLGTLTVNVAGLPKGAAPVITVTDGKSFSRTFGGAKSLAVTPGAYTVRANDLSLNGQTYRAQVRGSPANVTTGKKVNVNVVYTRLTPENVSVQLAPAEATLAPGASQTFTARVSGTSNGAVRWSATGGEVQARGQSATYRAPAEAGSYTITATSTADPSRSASATVVVQAPAPASGARVWVRQPALVDSFMDVAADAGGNAVAVGSVIEGSEPCNVDGRAGPPFCSYDAFVAKYDQNGVPLWTKSFGTPAADPTEMQLESATSVTTDAAGNVYVLATLLGSPANLPGVTAGADGTVLKFDAAGTLVWGKPLPDLGQPEAELAADAAGTLFVLGRPNEAASEGSAVLARLDANGDEVPNSRETLTFSGAYFASSPSGRVTLAGRDAATNEAVLRGLTPDGPPASERRFAPQGEAELPSGAALDAQGNAFVTWVSGAGETLAVTLRRYDAAGNAQASSGYNWRQNIDFLPQQGVYDVSLVNLAPLPGANGAVYLSYNVFTQAPGTRSRYRTQFLAKLGANGAQVWLNKLEASGGNTVGSLPALGADGQLYQAGWAQGSLEGAPAEGRGLEYQGFVIRWAP